jgi:alanine or glycine:cation symporter, AGCS family
MALVAFLQWVNETILAIPTTVLFFGAAVFFTFRVKFAQVTQFPRFIKLLTQPASAQPEADTIEKTIKPLHALFTAMATTIGMGNLVGPTIAIFTGGPGALLWLVLYIFFGAATKFVEVISALKTRTMASDGSMIGGPLLYLKTVSYFIAYWYGIIMIFMLASWSSLQANTLSSILMLHNIPSWFTGILLALFLVRMLSGGAERVGAMASKLVPLMFVLYVSVSFYILLSNPTVLWESIVMVFRSALNPSAAIGGFLGTTFMHAMQSGLYQGVFITESGIGTASIPHAVARTTKYTDQAILAMCATASDMILASLSGLLVLVTGVWNTGSFRSTLIYEAFKLYAPGFGSYVLLISLSLFILTTILGNSFNGTQIFKSITDAIDYRFYIAFITGVVFIGAIMPATIVWKLMETILACAMIPNVIGLLVLVMRNPDWYKINAA